MEEEYDEEWEEMQPHEDCPKCGCTYDDIDFDYQHCSKCAWDADKKAFSGRARKPTDEDYLNGDADILTGQWLH